LYDTRTGLIWARNLAALGTTLTLFAKAASGNGTRESDFEALKQRVSQLRLGDISSWRLATRQELETLSEAGRGSLFFSFERSQDGCRNLAGIFDSRTSRPAVWGYQQQNVLVGPIEWGWGDLTINSYGVWLVSGPSAQIPLDMEVVYEVQEQRVQQTLSPVISGFLLRSENAISSSPLTEESLRIGNLELGEQRAVFEYSLQPISNGEFVRVEIVLEAQATGGVDPIVKISPYAADGVLRAESFEVPALMPESFTTKWFPPLRAQLEIPIDAVRSIARAGKLLGLQLRFIGTRGVVQLPAPKLAITYVPKENLITSRSEYSSLSRLCHEI
jgi:hypothetical protein